VIDRQITDDGTAESAWCPCLPGETLRNLYAVQIVQPNLRSVVVAPRADDEVLVFGLRFQLAGLRRHAAVVATRRARLL
jgi:hypothetical protein